jgi:predicted dehydrogenase
VEAGGLDGVILATPPALHHEMAMACVASGLAVLVEKPLTLGGPSARALREAASARGVLVMVDHTHVFSGAFETLKARARRLTPPLRIRSIGGNRGPIRADVDGLWDYGPHDVSLCLDLLGSEPVAVQAQALAAAGDAGGGIGVRARLEFPGDVVAELTFGNGLSEKRRRFEVEGKGGTLLYDDLAEHKLVERDSRGRVTPIPLSPTPPLSRAVLAFRDAIVSGCREHPSLPLGVAVVETLERIAASVLASGAGGQ